MAIWQYQVVLLPQHWLDSGGKIESLYDGEGCDTAVAWAEYSNPQLEKKLSSILPAGKSWHDALQRWGSDEGDDIQLWREHGKVTDITIRFDLRNPYMVFFDSIVRAANELDLAILESSCRRLIVRDQRALLQAAAGSDAAHYTVDPLSFLEKMDTGGAKAT